MTTTEDGLRVSTLELFFDLVFVFTITQLTAVLVSQPDGRGLLSSVLMMGVTWWMYAGFVWLTNAVPAQTAVRRLMLMAGMAGFLTMALAIPKAFEGAGVVFGVGYLVVNLVHLGLFTRSGTRSVVAAILRFGPFNIASATLVLLAGIVGGSAEYWLWSAAFLLQVITPYVVGDEGFVIRAAHFVERHGLVVIIAFGESIIAIGIGATDLPVDGSLIGVALLGLALTGCLWWTYFGGDDDTRAEHALADLAPERRPRAALLAYGYAHLVLLFGVVTLAAGMKKAIGHAFEPASGATAWYLATGIALFLAGDVLFRLVLGMRDNGFRLVAMVAAIGSVPVGLEVSAFGQLATLLVVLAGALVTERLVAWPR